MDAAAGLLEPLHNRVTTAETGYEIARHRCRCWFCPDCCRSMGRRLRERLLPVLSTFRGLLLVTLTVDPTLFPSPQAAYEYMRERRCIARTMQDLWRAGCLHSRRYFYVVEWQKNTEQAHFHILLDASFVPWAKLLASWSKHRPETAGPVAGGRPGFGTALISVPRFGGGADHAASYVTKYLTKTPENGFPSWVLDLGQETRVRRYSASRGFWGQHDEHAETGTERELHCETYRKRVRACGDSLDVFERRGSVDRNTGEITVTRAWIGELVADSAAILAAIDDGGPPARSRRLVPAATASDVERTISGILGRPVEWRRGGHPKRRMDMVPERWTQEEDDEWRHLHYSVDSEITRFMESEK